MICFEWNFTHSTPITQATWFNTKVQVLRSSAVCVLMSLDVFSKLPFLLYSFDLFSPLFCSADSGSDAVPPRLSGCAWAAEIRRFFCSAPLDFHGFPKQLDLPATNECSVPVCQCAVLQWHLFCLSQYDATELYSTIKQLGAFIKACSLLAVSSVQIISTYHSTIFNHIKNHRCNSLIYLIYILY